MELKTLHVDVSFLVFCLVVIFLEYLDTTPIDTFYTVNVVQGLSTFAAIMIATGVFLLSHLLQHTKDESTRNNARKRVAISSLVFLFSILIMLGSFLDLLYGRLYWAAKNIFAGAAVAAFTFGDVVVVTLLREEIEARR